MKIDGNKIEYVKLKENSPVVLSKKVNESLNGICKEFNIILSILVFLCSWLLSFKGQSLYQFYMNFQEWSFFDFGFLFPPENTISLLVSLTLSLGCYKSLSFLLDCLDKKLVDI